MVRSFYKGMHWQGWACCSLLLVCSSRAACCMLACFMLLLHLLVRCLDLACAHCTSFSAVWAPARGSHANRPIQHSCPHWCVASGVHVAACSVAGGRNTIAWRTQNVGTARDRVTYTPTGWSDAFWWWRSWAGQEVAPARLAREQCDMTATLDTVADSYASIKTGHTQLWTANEAARQGRGCH
jgi:hypothetical protein